MKGFRRVLAVAMSAALLMGCAQAATHEAGSVSETASSSGASTVGGAEHTSTSPTGGPPSSEGDTSSSSAAVTPVVSADGKMLATGTVVNTTYADRAAEVGYLGGDFDGDTGLLTLLMLDTPLEVTAYHGGSDHTGSVSTICLPNDELFRQFKDRRITIGVDTWGEFPADVTGLLYDLVLDFDNDGLTLVEPAR